MKREQKDILHVYHGTQGAGGIYLNEIYKSLEKAEFSQELLVSYYFPFSIGKKKFFRYTDLIAANNFGKARKLLRFVELCYGLFYTFLYVVFRKPRIINYSLISSNLIDLIFLFLIRKATKSILIITCHDVIPFGETPKSIIRQKRRRKEILKFANYLLCHNDNSIDDLKSHFNIDISKILFHPFPIMDLNNLGIETSCILNKKFDFVMLGHLRESKGLDVLLKAWEIFSLKHPNATLLIAGNLPSNSSHDISLKNMIGIELKTNYLSDKDYLSYLFNARNVILPYKSGTNSGVLFNLVKMKVGIIYSNLPMFTSNELLPKEGVFKNKDISDLVKKMEVYFQNPVFVNSLKLEAYQVKFEKDVKSVYGNILLKK